MSKKIYKYQLETTDCQILLLPIGAQILTMQTQHGIPCVWAIIDTNETRNNPIKIETFGTGHSINENPKIKRNYLGTYQSRGGALIFHVFERTDL